ASDPGEPRVHGAMAAVGDDAGQGGDEDLDHRDRRHRLDVEAADAEERRHVEQEWDHDDGAADAEETRHEGSEHTEDDEEAAEDERHETGGLPPEARVV